MSEIEPHIKRQLDPRFLARIAIYGGPYQDRLLSGYTVNVGSGGLFIETATILAVDTMLTVQFKLPDMDRIISCNTRVAWTNCPPSLRKPALPPGMGIQFIDLSLEDMHAIRAFIDKGELVPTW